MKHFVGDQVILKSNENARVEQVFRSHAYGPEFLVVRLATKRPTGKRLDLVEGSEVRRVPTGPRRIER